MFSLWQLLTLLGRMIVDYGQPWASPTVTLDNAIVTGIISGSTSQFLGIPFAQPPTGNLRFQLPQALPPYDTDFSATTYGPACAQQSMAGSLPSDLPAETLEYLSKLQKAVIRDFAEDCLTLNVVAPSSATPTSKLPVVVWIYGGGFETGATEIYNGSVIVEQSISLNAPVVYVSMNYRLNAFGFLASQEVKDAGVGNLGLRDHITNHSESERLALRWVQKYVSAFGGDPAKVTIWGESAGAISIALQMLTNGGDSEGLFRAGFMQSGSPLPVGDTTHGQPYYDALVAETDCSAATDTLQCLREVPYEMLLNAVNKSPGVLSYQSIVLAWLPRVDGVFLTDNPQNLVQQGSVADIPFISGDCDDEGTVFSFSTLNITTDAHFEDWIHTYLFPGAPTTTIAPLLKHYPSDPIHGSPFDTGDRNALTPQFKRMAAIQGDYVFQAPRRFFVHNRSGKQSIWVFLSKRFKTLPILGAAHGTDLSFHGGDMTAYLVRFATNLDPNVGEGTDLYWPQYDAATNQTMLEFLDGSMPQGLTTDTYRAEAMAYLTKAMLANPL